MTRKLCLALALCAVLVSNARAEGKMAALTYTVSFPGSTTKDFIDEPSFLGLEFTARMSLRHHSPLLVGTTIGWQVFDHRSSDPVQLENGTVSGRQARYLNMVPFMVTAHYHFGASEGLHVFGGVGVGALYVYQQFQLGVSKFQSGNWQPVIAPEAGVQYPIARGTEIYASGRYNHSFERGDFLTGEAVAWDYWSLNVGLAWSDW